jgi:hypothetical protein
MAEFLPRNFADLLIRALLFLLFFSAGIVQLFFIKDVQRYLLRLRQVLLRVYERHPILTKLFGSPLKTIELKGYTVAKRIGGVILIIISIVILISIFQPHDPCEDNYWSITKREPC